jgi:hypothetical protein
MLLLQRKEGAQVLYRKLLGSRAFSLGLAFRKNVLSRTLCRTRARNVLASGSPEREPGIWHRKCPACFTAPSCRQASLAWWKQPLNFVSKKVVRYIEQGVKVEFKKGLPFPSKPSAPKFVDPQDVDFAIQDLLKGRRIGVYQDLAPGGEQLLFVTFVTEVSLHSREAEPQIERIL